MYRMCVGYKFAQMEGRLALARLFQSYNVQPAPDMPLPKWRTSLVYTADHVWVTVTPRITGRMVPEAQWVKGGNAEMVD